MREFVLLPDVCVESTVNEEVWTSERMRPVEESMRRCIMYQPSGSRGNDMLVCVWYGWVC